MVKIGFLEQMNQLNSELRISQEANQILTQWVSSSFQVDLQRYMKIPEMRQILNKASAKLATEYVKKTFVEHHSIGSISYV